MRDAAREMKERMRGDLRAALKGGRGEEARVIRALVAALDNAEAVPAEAGAAGEVERLWLGEDAVRAVLLAEIEERERAAAEMERVGARGRAEGLRGEVEVARRYVG